MLQWRRFKSDWWNLLNCSDYYKLQWVGTAMHLSTLQYCLSVCLFFNSVVFLCSAYRVIWDFDLSCNLLPLLLINSSRRSIAIWSRSVNQSINIRLLRHDKTAQHSFFHSQFTEMVACPGFYPLLSHFCHVSLSFHSSAIPPLPSLFSFPDNNGFKELLSDSITTIALRDSFHLIFVHRLINKHSSIVIDFGVALCCWCFK